MKKIIRLLSFVLLFIILLNIAIAKPKISSENYFTSNELNRIVAKTDLFESNIQTYSSKFSVPANILKALIGAQTGAKNIHDPAFNEYGEIGIAGLKPFDDEGNNVHYDHCVESKCMSNVESLSSNLETKKEQVEEQYLNIPNSICCAAYIISKENEKSENVNFDLDPDCADNKDNLITYTGWDATLRKFKGVDCNPDRDKTYFYFVERANQLYTAFSKSIEYSSSTFGILKFSPSFSIAPPTLIETFNKLPGLVADLQTAQSETEVNEKLDSFASKNKVAFGYCESPEDNLYNSFYDRLIGAYDSKETNCKYKITNNEIKLSGRDIELLDSIILNLSVIGDKLVLDNNFPSDSKLYHSSNLPLIKNLKLDVDKIEIIDDNSIIELGLFYNVTLTNGQMVLENVENIYLYKNKNSVDFIFSLYNENSELEYYDSNRVLIENVPSDCIKKYRYFTCLDTNKKEEVYDWATNKWVESDETVKIKFAFALPKSNP